ncbi:MAG: hypothetical protein M3N95_12760 [Actinomycetota bacterium]|nr:hypothetical protein [Actinomycetota bacterium]
MNELIRLSLDSTRAEGAYRSSLLTHDVRRLRRPGTRWWQRVALVPREHH